VYSLPQVERPDQNTEGDLVKELYGQKKDLFCVLVKLYCLFDVDVEVLTKTWQSSWEDYWQNRPCSDERKPEVIKEEKSYQMERCLRSLVEVILERD